MYIKWGGTCFDEAVAPVISKSWVPEAWGGYSRYGRWRPVNPLIECVENGEEVGDSLVCMCIEDQTSHGGGSTSAPTWLQPSTTASESDTRGTVYPTTDSFSRRRNS